MSNQISIAIDGNEANVSHRVGSNIYAFQILMALEELTRSDAEVTVTVLLAEPPVMDLPAQRVGWDYRVVSPRPLWTQLALPIHLYFHRYDVFFTPGHYAPRLSAVPYVSSVMDLAFLKFPEQFKPRDEVQLRQWTKYSVAKAKKVIVISQATKRDVMEYYHRRDQDVVVAYPAVTAEVLRNSLTPKTVLRKFGVAQPYLLYVGTLQPRKNIVRLVQAFEKLDEVAQKTKSSTLINKTAVTSLVLAGKVGWLADDIKTAIETSPVKDRIIVTGYVSDEEKKILYQQATALVLVGLYEGFGLPPLEAMQVGTLPIVSNTTSLPEVVGQAGLLVDPLDPDAIAVSLLQALAMSAKDRARYRKEARQQLKKFNWLESGRLILQTLKEVASHGS